MTTYRYTFNIPFKINNNSNFIINEENMCFRLDSYEVSINFDEKTKNGKFEVKYFYNEESIVSFSKNFKKAINILNLKYSLWSIKIDMGDDILKDNVSREEIDTSNDMLENNVYDFAINLEMDFEVNMEVQVTLDSIINDISDFYIEFCPVDFNKKLSTSLDLYADSFFQKPESRFLTYCTILELLKPKIRRSRVEKDFIEKLVFDIEKYQECKKIFGNNELNDVCNDLKDAINDQKSKSINHSIQQIPLEYGIELHKYENLDLMLKNAYHIRSKFVHEGNILEEFDFHLEFLNKFIPELLKNRIHYFKNLN